MKKKKGKKKVDKKKSDIDIVQEEMLCEVCPWMWSMHNKIRLQAGEFQLKGHEYQVEVLQSDAKHIVCRKSAQMGWSQLEILRTIHGLIHNKFPTGVLYLMPSLSDVSDFSKSRFKSLINDNPCIGKYVRDTDATHIKKVGNSFLYLRGGKMKKVEGQKEDSSALRSISVDKICADERDLISEAAIAMAWERMSHSEVREYVSFSTPTLPEYGISKEFEKTNKKRWHIKCRHCGKYTCLETDFIENPTETIINGKRVCRKCKKEIFSCDGIWIADYPDIKDKDGYHISQLNSAYVAPSEILELYLDPPNGNMAEIMNSKLGLPYVSAENRLAKTDVYNCCSSDAMAFTCEKQCFMGVDVGRVMHVVIGYRKNKNQLKIIKVCELPDYNALHDLARSFNVKFAVLDALPEVHASRMFAEQEPYEVYLNYYNESIKQIAIWDDNQGIVKSNRTDICDKTHNMIITQGDIEIPRRSPTIDSFATMCSNIAKCLEENLIHGGQIYRYRKLGADHFRHALNYAVLASTQTRPQNTLRSNITNRFSNWGARSKVEDRNKSNDSDTVYYST